IALTFGGAKADTIGVSFERGPSDKGVGSAGYFNNLAFKKLADREGRIAININGDVFSKQVREQVIEAIETYFEGEVDLVIYSIASGMRRKPGSEDFWRSAIKPIGEPVSGAAILLENDKWVDATLEPANEEEIDSTLRVMGGE
ncbi:bifunctional NADH-specific enoyl-ACP reductase/trans-2-enoyl-CoA reductase, partial [Vibrio parahaemolyticus]|nr:bifunctional NADH-specific enoyl-ACP reductase/trans-2-enoyl-CoA reductase [Vibrio parahaemolyticus]